MEDVMSKKKCGNEIGDYKMSTQIADHDGWFICDGRELGRKEYAELFAAAREECGDGGDQNADYKDDGAPNVMGSITGHDFEVYRSTMRAKMFYWFRYRLCDWFVIKWFNFVGKLRRYSNRIKKLFGGLF